MDGEAFLAEEYKRNLKSWVGDCRLRNKKNQPGKAGRQTSRGGEPMRTWWFGERWEERQEGRSWSVFWRKSAWIFIRKDGDIFWVYILGRSSEGQIWGWYMGSGGGEGGQIGDYCNSPGRSWWWQSQLIKKRGHLHWLREIESYLLTHPTDVKGERGEGRVLL